jgi:hypothetical protein
MNRYLLAGLGVALFGAGLLTGRALQTAPPSPLSNAEASADATTPMQNQVYELRTYTAHPGKLEELHTRFRDHTMRLFERHGMTNVGYWTPQDAPLSEITLVYLLAYPSREFAVSAWEAFRADPEWVEAKAASEVNGLLVESVQSLFLDPTDFSQLR